MQLARIINRCVVIVHIRKEDKQSKGMGEFFLVKGLSKDKKSRCCLKISSWCRLIGQDGQS